MLRKYIAGLFIAASFVLHFSLYQWEFIRDWCGYLINDATFHKGEMVAFAMIWFGIYLYATHAMARALSMFVVVVYLLSLNKEIFLNPHEIDYQDYVDFIIGLIFSILEGAGVFTMIKNIAIDKTYRIKFVSSVKILCCKIYEKCISLLKQKKCQ